MDKEKFDKMVKDAKEQADLENAEDRKKFEGMKDYYERPDVKARFPSDGAPAQDADFEENKHPRSDNGQFGSGGSEPATPKGVAQAKETLMGLCKDALKYQRAGRTTAYNDMLRRARDFAHKQGLDMPRGM